MSALRDNKSHAAAKTREGACEMKKWGIICAKMRVSARVKRGGPAARARRAAEISKIMRSAAISRPWAWRSAAVRVVRGGALAVAHSNAHHHVLDGLALFYRVVPVCAHPEAGGALVCSCEAKEAWHQAKYHYSAAMAKATRRHGGSRHAGISFLPGA